MENAIYCGRMKGARAGPQSARRGRRALPERVKLVLASIILLAAWSGAAWVWGFCEGKTANLIHAGIELSELER